MGFFKDLSDEVKNASFTILKGAAVIGAMTICIIAGFDAHDTNNNTPEQNMENDQNTVNETSGECAQELFSDPTRFHSYP